MEKRGYVAFLRPFLTHFLSLFSGIPKLAFPLCLTRTNDELPLAFAHGVPLVSVFSYQAFIGP